MKKLLLSMTAIMALALAGCDKEESYEEGPRVEPERLNVRRDAAEEAGGRTPTPQQMGNTNDKGMKPMDFGPFKHHDDTCGCGHAEPATAPAPASAGH